MTRYLLIAALLFSASVTIYPQNHIKVGSPAPQFTATGVDGRKYDLAALRGSPVVLTFWSTRCAICQSEMPKLDQMVARYGSKNVVFLSATPEPESRVKYYLSLNRVATTILPDSFGLMLQYADRDASGYVNIMYPAYFVIDGSGTLQYRGNGYSKIAAVSGTLDRLLAN